MPRVRQRERAERPARRRLSLEEADLKKRHRLYSQIWYKVDEQQCKATVRKADRERSAVGVRDDQQRAVAGAWGTRHY
jgi:hypothetical protein